MSAPTNKLYERRRVRRGKQDGKASTQIATLDDEPVLQVRALQVLAHLVHEGVGLKRGTGQLPPRRA